MKRYALAGTYASELARRGWDVVGGVTRGEVEAFPGREMLSVEPADTAGLGWPQNKTSPQWYRLRRQA